MNWVLKGNEKNFFKKIIIRNLDKSSNKFKRNLNQDISLKLIKCFGNCDLKGNEEWKFSAVGVPTSDKKLEQTIVTI